MDIQSYLHEMGQAARAASRVLARADTRSKNLALHAIADAIEQAQDTLLAANHTDLAAAHAANLAPAMLDRLTLSASGISVMAEGLRQIAALPDPVGEMDEFRYHPSGIQLGKMRVPLGVIGIIYEARPNVTADAAGLCLKSGNAVILRGGSEALNSNRAIAACVHAGLRVANLPESAVQVIDTTDRAAVGALITLSEFVDVIIPRGGKSLIARVSAEARVPVIKHLDGNCHVYVDAEADLAQALRIADNAKTQRYGTCNTMETLLVHRTVAAIFLPQICRVYADKGVELRGDDTTQHLAGVSVLAATEDDWYTEYAAPIVAIKVVDSLEAAIEHINHYGSHHTDAIVTQHYAHAQRFLREVDSSSVMVNASTRFADGYEYGLGAEIGISTDKIHARGPVGLMGLTSQKWVVLGDGQIRE